MYLVSRCQYEHEDECGVDYEEGHGSVCLMRARMAIAVSFSKRAYVLFVSACSCTTAAAAAAAAVVNCGVSSMKSSGMY